MTGPMLTVRGVSVRFGGLTVLQEVDLTLWPGSALSVIGPNGAGKTTLVNCISGFVVPEAGSIRLERESVELVGRPSRVRARLGIGRTFQHSDLFDRLTVLDQLLCGAYHRSGHGPVGALLRLPGALRGERELEAQARDVLEQLGLGAHERSAIDGLPGGLRRLVDLGRALMLQPQLLLLDEIAAGTTQEERDRIADVVGRFLAAGDRGVIVIEHDLDFVRRLTEHVVVLAEGRVMSTGETNEVLARPEVLDAYVGVAE
jgi:ABC-type branched-subunit amino acid transport system ATPase component